MENNPSGTPTPATVPATAAAGEDKTVAIVSYITIIGFIAAVIIHMNKKTMLGSFHLRQMLGIILTFIAGGLVMIIPVLGWVVGFVVYIGAFVLWVMGLINAINGKMEPVPLVGAHYQKWFAGAFN